ncbi:MAG: YlbF family regulator [Kiritimatiellae bacterium]|nr:YlbF family regulator [Kiritimatiellia bacterium]MDW8459427.1 YlbF family regulator [Verrucomicrobiota bacterium]
MKPIVIQQDETPVIQKTKELCQTILDQPAYQQIRQTILDFLSNESMRLQYQRLCDLQDELHEKQESGLPITDEDIAEFEREENDFLRNPLAQRFIDAQRAMHKVEQTVAAYVRKTFELGRLPTDDDFGHGGCGPSCGCH